MNYVYHLWRKRCNDRGFEVLLPLTFHRWVKPPAGRSGRINGCIFKLGTTSEGKYIPYPPAPESNTLLAFAILPSQAARSF